MKRNEQTQQAATPDSAPEGADPPPGATPGKSTAPRLIKKYPNRRLYDTRTSSYITVADIKRLVLASEAFAVVDAKTGEDITRSILLQVILEEEAGGAPMFSLDVLEQMIRCYGSTMQDFMGRYLENNMRAFADMQQKMQEQGQALFGDKNPLGRDLWTQFLNFQGPAMQSMMSTYMEQSRNMFQQMQEQIGQQTRSLFSGFNFPGMPPGTPEDKPPKA
ncbi:MAG TPA: polyhydroxyalkanoate synthesis repressor PhaR [Rhodocyclaceae bacterium]|nr:polyhydroxyalkanoate synthesis repressor PhaR [Rhodocyclaceae bacterium]